MAEAASKAERLLMLLPYPLLLCSLGVMWAARNEVPHQPFPRTIGLVVLTAVWLLWWTTLHPSWARHRGRMVVFFVGLLVLMYLLIWCSPLFGIFEWTGYLYASYALARPWPVLSGGVPVAVGAAIAQVGGFGVVGRMPIGLFLLVVLVNVLIATAMVMASIAFDNQSARRAAMIEELAEANAKLAAALRENAGLHAQLMVQAREAGVLDERQRMAGEIHDVLAQGLAGIVTQLEAAEAAARQADRGRHLHTAKQLARESLTEARRSVQALRPRTLDAAALPEAIAEIVEAWSDRTGVPAELITTGAARALLPDIEATLLRTAQEALANVDRHAAAGRGALTLSYMEDVVTLDVRDDGAGFDPAVMPAPSEDGGYGLAAMRERLLRIAGTLDVESEPGGGTALSACVPAITAGAAA